MPVTTDGGYLLKYFDDKGWTLFDMKKLTIIAAVPEKSNESSGSVAAVAQPVAPTSVTETPAKETINTPDTSMPVSGSQPVATAPADNSVLPVQPEEKNISSASSAASSPQSDTIKAVAVSPVSPVEIKEIKEGNTPDTSLMSKTTNVPAGTLKSVKKVFSSSDADGIGAVYNVANRDGRDTVRTVSYTHLTLPTICSV